MVLKKHTVNLFRQRQFHSRMVREIIQTNCVYVKKQIKDYIDKIGKQLKQTKDIIERMQQTTQSMKKDTDNGDALIRVREQQVAGTSFLFLLTKYRTIAYTIGTHERVPSTTRRLST